MNALLLATTSLHFGLAFAQDEFTPCPYYCFPRNDQGAVDLTESQGTCPSYADYLSWTMQYWTETCTCYDYTIIEDNST